MRPAPDLTLYLVTDTGLCGGTPEGVAATARAAVAGGVTLVQVRDPHADDARFAQIGRAVVEALTGTGVPVVLDDRVHLVADVGAHGAHVGQADLAPEQARALLGPDAILGLSVHDTAELDAARSLPPGTVDHLGVGPLRATTSKPDHRPVRGLAQLGHLMAGSPWPCVVIGGVTAADAPAVRAAGAAGVAVVSAICGRPDPKTAAADLRAAWDAASGSHPSHPHPTADTATDEGDRP